MDRHIRRNRELSLALGTCEAGNWVIISPSKFTVKEKLFLPTP